ncbi:MAG: ribose 5-phosphate isomerase A [Ignavibacteria bacterium RBG_13_36_8]|nr:MAG: ribose 5-phosphate isomerase A [Ignavibacteria bacterium RBG_13_36_8]
MNQNELKKQAADYAVTNYIKSGMIVGLGAGSTSLFALKKISELISKGELKNILGIPSSLQTEREAVKLNIPLTTLEEHNVIDVTIDGADETDPQKNLIKGGGGAMLREKVLAQASRQEIIIIDESKYSETLGTKFPVPVEVIPFAVTVEKIFLESLGAKVQIRIPINKDKFITDDGNNILDCDFGPIKDPRKLSALLNERAGIVEHGIFIDLCTHAVIAGKNGIRVI